MSRKIWTTQEKVTATDLNGNFDLLYKRTFTAGQDISAGNFVAISPGGTANISTGVTANSGPGSDAYVAQTITMTEGCTFQDFTVSCITGLLRQVDVSVKRTSGGLPTGSALATASYSNGGGYTPEVLSISLNVPVTFAKGEQLAIIFHRTTADNDGMPAYLAAGGYTGGAHMTSADGSSWTPTAYDMQIVITAIWPTAGRVIKTSAFSNNAAANAVVGVALAGVSSGASVDVDINPVATLSGLTTGSTYYLSDTEGSIGTSAGTNSRKIGLALSTTELLMKRDNP